jgi:ABC-type dipeptide/oligopeptide/nickel transport system permease component
LTWKVPKKPFAGPDPGGFSTARERIPQHLFRTNFAGVCRKEQCDIVIVTALAIVTALVIVIVIVTAVVIGIVIVISAASATAGMRSHAWRSTWRSPLSIPIISIAVIVIGIAIGSLLSLRPFASRCAADTSQKTYKRNS